MTWRRVRVLLAGLSPESLFKRTLRAEQPDSPLKGKRNARVVSADEF